MQKLNELFQLVAVSTPIKIHGYSGVLMHGKRCLAISGELLQCREFLKLAGTVLIDKAFEVGKVAELSFIETEAKKEGLNNLIQLQQSLLSWRADSSELGVTYVWTMENPPEGEDDGK